MGRGFHIECTVFAEKVIPYRAAIIRSRNITAIKLPHYRWVRKPFKHCAVLNKTFGTPHPWFNLVLSQWSIYACNLISYLQLPPHLPTFGTLTRSTFIVSPYLCQVRGCHCGSNLGQATTVRRAAGWMGSRAPYQHCELWIGCGWMPGHRKRNNNHSMLQGAPSKLAHPSAQ